MWEVFRILFPTVALLSFLFAGDTKNFPFKFCLLWLKAGDLGYRSLSAPLLGLLLPLGSPFLDSLCGMPDIH